MSTAKCRILLQNFLLPIAAFSRRFGLNMNKKRTQITLSGDDVDLLDQLKDIISDKAKSKRLPSSANVIRMAMDAYKDILNKG